jgi:hypothetical protein
MFSFVIWLHVLQEFDIMAVYVLTYRKFSVFVQQVKLISQVLLMALLHLYCQKYFFLKILESCVMVYIVSLNLELLSYSCRQEP